MYIDADTIFEANEVTKELFLSMDRASKDALLKRLIAIETDKSPHRFVNWNWGDVETVASFVKETPARRRKLKRFSPEKIDLPMLTFKSYYLLEYSLSRMIDIYIWTRNRASLMEKVVVFGRISAKINSDEDNQTRLLADPLSFYAGSFFYDEYPYDETVFSVCNGYI